MDTRFELVGPLGEGGQGRVALVRDRQRQGKLVALKRVGEDEELRRDLAVEFSRLAGIRHPNIARAYDYSEDDEGPYFTCEYIDGPNIVTWARGADHSAVVHGLAALLRGLSLLHDRELVHGDLSPDNALVASSKERPSPKLLDLGGARRPGQPGGATTPGYAAPEVLTGRGVLVTSDLYSFGVLLAETLLGKHPFGASEASETVARQLEGKIDLPDPEVSPVSALCRQLLDPDPARRPRSASATLSRLAAATELDLGLEMTDLRAGDLPDPRIVGRRAELATLSSLVDRLDDPAGLRTAMVTGGDGSGRSTILAEAIRVAQLAGLRVVGRAGGPISAEELLDGLAAAAGRERLTDSVRAVLKPWLVGETDARSPEAVSVGTETVGFAAAEVLANACLDKAVVVVVDDVDDCSPLVRGVLATLARALTPGRTSRPAAVLVIAGGEGDPGATPFAELAGVRLPLGPLDGEETRALVASMLPEVNHPPDLPRTIFLASGGLPGATTQLVRQAVGTRTDSDLEGLARERVSSLSPESASLLAALSCVGAPCPSAQLQAIGATEDQLEQLLASGFAFEVAGAAGPTLDVPQPIGDAARELAAPGELKKRRIALAQALLEAGLGAQAAEMWLGAGKNDRASRAFASLAEGCRGRGDLAGAGHWYSRALEAAGDDVDGDTVLEAVRVWRGDGRLEEALAWLPRTSLDPAERDLLAAEIALEQGRHQEAFELARRIPDEPTVGLSRAGVIAAAELQLGRHEQALATALEGLDSAPEGEGERGGLARLSQIAGLARTYLGRLDEAEADFDLAEAGFEAAGDLTGRIKLSGNRGMMRRRAGDLIGAGALYDDAVALARAARDRSRERLHLMNRATIAATAGELDLAHQNYLAALDIAMVQGNDFARAQVEVNLADLLSGLGSWSRALDLTSDAAQRCRVLGQVRLEARAMLIGGEALLRAGALDRAERRLVESRLRFAAQGDDAGQLVADIHLAELRLAKGDARAAHELASRAEERARLEKMPGERARSQVMMARALLAGEGDLERALALVGEAKRLVSTESPAVGGWRLDYHRARILEAAGRGEAATRCLAAARKALDDMLERVPREFHESFLGWGEAAELVEGRPAPDAADGDGREVIDLERLMEINRELTRERDLKRLLLLIMEHAVELTGAERGMVVLRRDGALEPVISHQISEDADVSFSRSVAQKVVADRRAVLAIDALGDDRFRAFVSVHTQKLRSILATPLSIRGQVVGVVYLDSRLKVGVFSEEDRRLLDAFGAQAAIALETARLISENARRCDDLQHANEEIRSLSDRLEEKLEHNEAKLRRVGALLQKTQTDEADRLVANGIVGRAPAMQQVMKMVDRIALTDVPIYIFGASGTGKELVARAIHAGSERAEHPFVPVNCGALPPKLLASELFGHARGSFTGAVSDRPGLFKLADGGTLFLDEVVDMDPEMQAHLLRVLQDGTFRAVGDNEELSVDVRVLSASNRDLEQEVRAGRFREDLFYRLNVVRVDVPPLADRREDIPLLADFFARQGGGDDPPRFEREAIDLLVAADWPGNVRELENEVLRAMAMADPDQPIRPSDLSPRLTAGGEGLAAAPSGGGSLKERVDGFERVVIQRVIAECGGNATRSAKALGISRAGLYKKLDKHGIRR